MATADHAVWPHALPVAGGGCIRVLGKGAERNTHGVAKLCKLRPSLLLALEHQPRMQVKKASLSLRRRL